MALVECLDEAHGERYSIYQGDCVSVLRHLPEKSIDFSVFSPPFMGLYIYSDSAADMANCVDDAAFMRHYNFLAEELYRVTKPGRLVAVHCKDLVYYATQRGTSGLRDFPGDLIRAHISAGFDFRSRVTIWRCPVREMTKTKAQGLLYKQLRQDSSLSRQGLPEYLLVFRRWPREGEDVEPVTHTPTSFPLSQWQEWASPVWMETRETDTLEAEGSRDPSDEKHICPMPLDLITRAVCLWSNPGDVVLSPFGGIGSEGVAALRNGRRAVLVELKESYFRQAAKALDAVDRQRDLFATEEPARDAAL